MTRCQEDMLQLLSLHKNCNDSLLDRASRLRPEEIELSTDPEKIKIRRMVNSVQNEIHYMWGFVRLKPLGDVVLYGYMKPEHDIGHRVTPFFARRFPKTIILLGNNSRSWISFNDGKRIVHAAGNSLAKTLEELKSALGACEDGEAEKLWETYFWSQYCDERRNLRYFNQNMPKKYRKMTSLRVERNNLKTIDDFC